MPQTREKCLSYIENVQENNDEQSARYKNTEL